jgi:hypothetical protein
MGVPLGIYPHYNYAAWSDLIAKYNTLIGYRLDPDLKNNGIRILKNELQFYYKNIQKNLLGFRSNYEYGKRKSADLLFIVCSDSFTVGLCQSRSWPKTF